ncbi:MAG: hypothetical protein ACFFE8_08985 [Candidatus Heimdallarchaeota archaeon]
MGNATAVLESNNYIFSQLNPLYDEHSLFGVQFDFNTKQGISDEKVIYLKQNLLTRQTFNDTSDPDLNEDNIVSMVVHQTPSIQSTVLALEKVKRTHPFIGAIKVTSIVPYIKYLHHFELLSGEDVVITQDFLGLALRINGSGFNPAHYQLGYGNIPLEFLESLYGGNFSTDTSTTLLVEIEEMPLGVRIDMTYSNITYLFQTENIDFSQVSAVDIANKFLLVQFGHITFSLTIRKYISYEIEGVETISDVSIGRVTNLIINEELPAESVWPNSTQAKIEKTYNQLFTINETISWYKGADIQNRLDLFPEISLSLLTGHNIGVFNDTEPLKDIQREIDGQNRTISALNEADFLITETVDVFHDGILLTSAPVTGRNYVVQEESEGSSELFIPAITKTIAFNQHIGFSGAKLFSQETSLVRDLVVDSIKRFVENSNVSSLTRDELYRLSNLYLTDTQYNREFRLPLWAGTPFAFSSLQYAVKNSPISNLPSNGQITSFLSWSNIILILSLVILTRKKWRHH